MTPDEPDVIAAAPVAPEARVAPVAPVAPISAAPEASAQHLGFSQQHPRLQPAQHRRGLQPAPRPWHRQPRPRAVRRATARAPRRSIACSTRMCEARASDLHLSVRRAAACPPRTSEDPASRRERACSRSRVDAGAARADHAGAQQRGIERRHDADFAYEIAGLARFRSNVFADRQRARRRLPRHPVEDPDRRNSSGLVAAHHRSCAA